VKNRASQQRFEVQWYNGHVYVTRQRGMLPCPQPGHVVVKMIACGICGADIRAVSGNKVINSDPRCHLTLGHEGVGRVVAIGSRPSEFRKGDCVAVLPHVLLSSGHDLDVNSESELVDPVSIGLRKTWHMGWDIDGCFSEYITVPAQNLVRIDPVYLQQARALAPDLGEAVFALTEPMLCTLTAYALMEKHLHSFARRYLMPGRALVIGCGPTGMQHAMTLLKRGFEVWVTDRQEKRVSMARWLLNHRVQVMLDPTEYAGKFHLVVVTPSSAEAIRMGETVVRDRGILYLFAGLNTGEREEMDPDHVFFYEQIHRNAKGVLTTTRLASEEKTILYLGHSGYYQTLANEAVATVAANADHLERIVTGVIRGWTNPSIEARLPGGINWTTPDGSPAIISVLTGQDLRDRHCKLLVITG
jgi:threonine dehydrogenase-like Zn-dependent dehydrogenase